MLSWLTRWIRGTSKPIAQQPVRVEITRQVEEPPPVRYRDLEPHETLRLGDETSHELDPDVWIQSNLPEARMTKQLQGFRYRRAIRLNADDPRYRDMDPEETVQQGDEVSINSVGWVPSFNWHDPYARQSSCYPYRRPLIKPPSVEDDLCT